MKTWFDLIAEYCSRDPSNVIKKVCNEFEQGNSTGSQAISELVRILQKYDVQYVLMPGDSYFDLIYSLFERSTKPYFSSPIKQCLSGIGALPNLFHTT